MSPIARTVHLATTDPDFRRALQLDPQAATAAHGLALGDEELEVLRTLHPLLALSPAELVQAVLASGSLPPWYGEV